MELQQGGTGTYTTAEAIAQHLKTCRKTLRVVFLAEFFDWWVSWVFHSTASHAAHIDLNAALGRSAMAATTARCECWLCRRRRLCRNGLTFWWVETQKIVVLVVAKRMVRVGKTLWFRAFSLCLQLDLFIIIYIMMIIMYVFAFTPYFLHLISILYIYIHIHTYRIVFAGHCHIKNCILNRSHNKLHLAFPTSCVRKEVGETTPEKVGNLNQLQSI